MLQTIELDRGCFACMLGGADGRTLFMVAAEWGGPEQMADGPRTGQVLTIAAPAAGYRLALGQAWPGWRQTPDSLQVKESWSGRGEHSRYCHVP